MTHKTKISADVEHCDQAPRRAMVAFGGHAEYKSLRLLRPGFRHCFAVIESQGNWVMYNPLSIGTQLDIWPAGSEETLCLWLEEHDYKVIMAEVKPLDLAPLPWSIFSCVEAVKRVLGVRAPWIMTPWQLYKSLTKNDGKKSLTFASY
ncbi:MAG: hypothetical protein OQK24_04215 [Magnetovibrio sp.]|nr:hypothetical protein [Magnetovibrio sp.]